MEYYLWQKHLGYSQTVSINLKGDEVIVGRFTHPDLDKYNLAERHAVFQVSDTSEWWIKGTGNILGLYVNGQKVNTQLHKLEIGDVIGFGSPDVDASDKHFICIFLKKVKSIDIFRNNNLEAASESKYINQSDSKAISKKNQIFGKKVEIKIDDADNSVSKHFQWIQNIGKKENQKRRNSLNEFFESSEYSKENFIASNVPTDLNKFVTPFYKSDSYADKDNGKEFHLDSSLNDPEKANLSFDDVCSGVREIDLNEHIQFTQEVVKKEYLKGTYLLQTHENCNNKATHEYSKEEFQNTNSIFSPFFPESDSESEDDAEFPKNGVSNKSEDTSLLSSERVDEFHLKEKLKTINEYKKCPTVKRKHSDSCNRGLFLLPDSKENKEAEAFLKRRKRICR